MEPRSIRLNNQNRTAFINQVLDELFPLAKAPNDDTFTELWGDRVYEYLYGPYKEIIEQLPEWAKTKTKRFSAIISGDVLSFSLNKEVIALENGHSSILRNIFCPVGTIANDSEIAIAYRENKQQHKDWRVKQAALKKELDKVVSACNTSAQLYQAWPKSLEFAYLFEYKESKRTVKPKVSSAALDVTLSIAKSTVTSLDEN